MDTKETQPATSELPLTEPTLCEGSESSGQKGIVKLGKGRKRVSFKGNYPSLDSKDKSEPDEKPQPKPHRKRARNWAMDLETIEQLEAKCNIHCNIMSIENSINEVYDRIEGHRQPELNANQLK